MHILSFNSTKRVLYFGETTGAPVKFAIQHSGKLEFDAADLRSLEKSVHTLIDSTHRRMAIDRIVILRCQSGGRFPSSVEAIKAEGIVELVSLHLGIQTILVAPQSLPATLGAKKGTKWQTIADSMFNGSKIIGFSAGINGAIAAAFKVVKDA